MARTWVGIRVDLLGGGPAGALWPTPGRVLVVGPSHSFADLATAHDDAFARWDRSHLYEFMLADGRRSGLPDQDDEEPVLDGARTEVIRTLAPGSESRDVFDLVPDRPLPSEGWGTISDQYGRVCRDDDGGSPPPAAPADPDPMLASSWPDPPPPGR